MQKKDGLKKPTNLSLQDAYKCGECLHYRQSKHPSFENVCSTLGVRTFAIAPRCYTPDYPKVIKNIDEFVQLASLFNGMTTQQKRIFVGILKQAPTGRKLHIGTKVYLNYRGTEYVSNYLCAYVVGYTSAHEIVVTGSPELGSRGRAFFAYLKGDESLLTPKEWRTKFLKLRKAGRIQDPKSLIVRDITKKVADDTYEVPTIDNAPKNPADKRRKEHDMRKVPLTQIMSF
jgi:hypothetical protein